MELSMDLWNLDKKCYDKSYDNTLNIELLIALVV